MKIKKQIRISTILEIEINEICELYIMNKRNCIRIIEIFNCLVYKDPITYKNLDIFKVKEKFIKLFSIHKNNRKNTTYFKISTNNILLNKKNCELKIKPSSDLKLETYGIKKQTFI